MAKPRRELKKEARVCGNVQFISNIPTMSFGEEISGAVGFLLVSPVTHDII